MVASDWVMRGPLHLRVVLKAAEVHRGECLTGSVEVQGNEAIPVTLPELHAAIRAMPVAGARRRNITKRVVSKRGLRSWETHEFPFSLELPVTTLLGPGQMDLTARLGIVSWRLVRMPLTVLPERHLYQVVGLIGNVADHWVASWASSPSVSGIYAHLAPNPSMRERASGLTIELETVGRHVKGKLTLTAITGKSWLENKEQRFDLEFETKLRDVPTHKPDLVSLRKDLEPFFRCHLRAERELPIPHEFEDATDGLPVPVP